MSADGWFARWYFTPAPAERLATLRLLVGGFGLVYLIARAPALAHFGRLLPTSFAPIGVTRVLDGPLPATVVWLLWAATVVAAAAFALGYRYRISGPAFGLLLLWVTSYRNSWGMIFHTDNLLVVHALCLAAVPQAAATLSLDTRAAGAAPPPDAGRFGWPIKLLCALTLAAYFLAGLAKLRGAGLAWAHGDVLRNYIAFDAMRKIQIGSLHSPFGAWLVQFEAPFPAISALTFAMELGAPLALIGPRIALVFAAGFWAFHLGVLLTMAIAFPYPLSGIGLAPLLPAERVLRWGPLARLRSALMGGERAPY
jgi:hypothetical protein